MLVTTQRFAHSFRLAKARAFALICLVFAKGIIYSKRVCITDPGLLLLLRCRNVAKTAWKSECTTPQNEASRWCI